MTETLVVNGKNFIMSPNKYYSLWTKKILDSRFVNLCWRHMIVDIWQSIENIMDRKDFQRGSIEKDGNMQRNSETIQEKEITVSRTSISCSCDVLRRKDGRQKIPWPTKKYLDN